VRAGLWPERQGTIGGSRDGERREKRGWREEDELDDLTKLMFLRAGYECPTGTHGFYDAPASYADWLAEIGIESRESLLILRVATPVLFAACGPWQTACRLKRSA
jgi:hypothetical protein